MRANLAHASKDAAGMTDSVQASQTEDPDIMIKIACGEFAVREGLGALMSALKTLPVPEDVRPTVEIILAEVLNNVVEHAYGAGAEGMIEVSATHRQDGLRFMVRDEGKPLPDEALPPCVLPDIGETLEALPEGGFGWFLIQDLAEDIAYLRKDGCNFLSLRVPIDPSAQVD